MNPGIDETAAEWLARREAGLSSAEEQSFQTWLAADARHRAAYAELEQTWAWLDGVRAAILPAGAPNPDALAPRSRRRRPVWLAPVLAAAAVLAVAYAGWWRPAGAAAQSFAGEAATAIGGIQKLDLPDGSVVRLNTDSRVEVRFTAGERRLRLIRGEAHFTVAKNPSRPFFVEAGTVAVRAVGTAFNVRLRDQEVEVLVTEGRVQVADPVEGRSLLVPRAPEVAPLLVAGERAVVVQAAAGAAPRPRAHVQPLAAPEIDRVLAWRDRRIEVVAAPLADIVREFNRFNRQQLEIAEPALAARRFGGSFRADEPETFVRLLQVRFELEVERRGDVTILREAAGRAR
jgi:transmembrane sensor